MSEDSSTRRRRSIPIERMTLGRPLGGGWLARTWWVVLLRAIAAIAFGVLAFAWPRHTAAALISLFGAFALCDGALALLAGSRRRGSSRGAWLVMSGVTSMAAGVFAFLRPREMGFALVTIVGVWLILRGLSELGHAVFSRATDNEAGVPEGRDWRLATDGAASGALGAGLLILPHVGALTILWGLGAWAILHGALMSAYALRLRQYDGVVGDV
jgi:uncharacterized membrane protein HdeD (DUF308 family)